MMGNGTPKLASLSRSLAMLEAVIEDEGRSSLSAIARQLGVPVATAHRQVQSLITDGYLIQPRRGALAPGPRLMKLLTRLDEKLVIASAAAPALHRLAEELGCVIQLGTLEGDMVTYRIKTGRGADGLFTRVGMQLEAYCSAIGKVLLAHLPEDQQAAYLAGGPFPALTPRTITDPAELAAELARVRERGFALDDAEVADDLLCVAVPIRRPDGRVLAAISATQAGQALRPPQELLPRIEAVAAEIEASLSPPAR